MSGRLVILGSGTSFGVPVIGCGCAVCRSDDPRDRRTRTAAVIETQGVRLLIDTPPELRLQLVGAGIDAVDAVFYTHEHADHVGGIDDLRAMSVRRGPLTVYGPPDTLAELARRFAYIFDPAIEPLPGTNKPELRPIGLAPLEPVQVDAVSVLPVEFDHGGSRVYGYRVGVAAYLTDVKMVSDTAYAALEGIEVLVINALFERPHPTHLSFDEAVAVARRIGASRTFITHLTHRYAHRWLETRLPDGIAPAHDGLVIPF